MSFPQDREGMLNLYRQRLKENKEKCMKQKKSTKINHGQYIAEILKAFPDDKYIVKTVGGSRFLVHCKKAIDKSRLKVGTLAALDVTTLTVMRILPHEIDPKVYNMMTEDPGKVSYSSVGGLSSQIRD